MAILHLGWEIAGDVQLARALRNVAVDLQDLRVPLRRVGDEVIYPATRHQFAAEGDPRWPALSPEYARRKAQKAPGAGILHLTGALEDSLTDKSDSQAVYRLDKLSLEIGSQLQVGKWNLALIHFKPETAPVPARKMMRLDTADQSKFVRIFDEWLNQEMRRQGILL